MSEVWKDIPGYEGKYSISDMGRLKNHSGVILKPMKCTNGYLSACLWKENRQKKILIHRIVAEVYIVNDNEYDEVNHKDEDKSNNVVTNLEWCSHKYNMNYGNVGSKIGNKNRGRKLTPEHRAKCASAKDKKWIHNGIRELLVKKEDVHSFLLLGYKLGRLSGNVRKSESITC